MVDTLADVKGYLASLEHPYWSTREDRNLFVGSEACIARYKRFIASQNTAQLDPAPEVDEAWISDCSSILSNDEEEVLKKKERGWLCKHWPAGLTHNSGRSKSMERRRPRKDKAKMSSKDPDAVSTDIAPPFEPNPYDTFHFDNHNRMRCCTAKAYEYWVGSSLTLQELGSTPDEQIVSSRVKTVLRFLVLSRNLFSMTVVDEVTKAEEQVGGNLPEARIATQ
jgi:hypothetical protein